MPVGALKGTLSVATNSITNPTDATGSVVVVINDLIFVVVCEQTSLTAGTVTDNLGNTYTALNAGTDAGAITGRAYYSIATVAGTLTTIHAAATASTDNAVVIAAVIAGPFLASGALDANPANTTADITSPFTCPSTGALGQGYEVVMAWGVEDGNTAWTATAPNTLAIQTTTQAVGAAAIGYQTVLSTSAVAPVFAAASNPGADVLGTASFKLAPVVGWEQVNQSDTFAPSPKGAGGSPT